MYSLIMLILWMLHGQAGQGVLKFILAIAIIETLLHYFGGHQGDKRKR